MANPFKDMAELLMMEASSASRGGTMQQVETACDKACAMLRSLLPRCRSDMPMLHAQLVATLVRRIAELVLRRDEAEMKLFA